MKLKPINSEEDYERALLLLDSVFDAEVGSEEAVDREKLVELIMAYEDKHYPIDTFAVDVRYDSRLKLLWSIPMNAKILRANVIPPPHPGDLCWTLSLSISRTEARSRTVRTRRASDGLKEPVRDSKIQNELPREIVYLAYGNLHAPRLEVIFDLPFISMVEKHGFANMDNDIVAEPASIWNET